MFEVKVKDQHPYPRPRSNVWCKVADKRAQLAGFNKKKISGHSMNTLIVFMYLIISVCAQAQADYIYSERLGQIAKGEEQTFSCENNGNFPVKQCLGNE